MYLEFYIFVPVLPCHKTVPKPGIDTGIKQGMYHAIVGAIAPSTSIVCSSTRWSTECLVNLAKHRFRAWKNCDRIPFLSPPILALSQVARLLKNIVVIEKLTLT